MSVTEPPNKKDLALTLRSRGTLRVHFDPRGADVIVPFWAKSQPEVVAEASVAQARAAHIDDSGLSGTFSINGAPFDCAIPWAAVFALAGPDGRGQIWQNAAPKELAYELGGSDTTYVPRPASPLVWLLPLIGLLMAATHMCQNSVSKNLKKIEQQRRETGVEQ